MMHGSGDALVLLPNRSIEGDVSSACPDRPRRIGKRSSAYRSLLLTDLIFKSSAEMGQQLARDDVDRHGRSPSDFSWDRRSAANWHFGPRTAVIMRSGGRRWP